MIIYPTLSRASFAGSCSIELFSCSAKFITRFAKPSPSRILFFIFFFYSCFLFSILSLTQQSPVAFQREGRVFFSPLYNIYFASRSAGRVYVFPSQAKQECSSREHIAHKHSFTDTAIPGSKSLLFYRCVPGLHTKSISPTFRRGGIVLYYYYISPWFDFHFYSLPRVRCIPVTRSTSES